MLLLKFPLYIDNVEQDIKKKKKCFPPLFFDVMNSSLVFLTFSKCIGIVWFSVAPHTSFNVYKQTTIVATIGYRYRLSPWVNIGLSMVTRTKWKFNIQLGDKWQHKLMLTFNHLTIVTVIGIHTCTLKDQLYVKYFMGIIYCKPMISQSAICKYTLCSRHKTCNYLVSVRPTKCHVKNYYESCEFGKSKIKFEINIYKYIMKSLVISCQFSFTK